MKCNFEAGAFGLIVLGSALASVALGRIPQPGPKLVRAAITVGAVAVGLWGAYWLLAGSEPEPFLGVVLVAGGTGRIVWHAEGARIAVGRSPRRGVWCASILAVGILCYPGVLLNRPKPELPGGPLDDETLMRVRVGMSQDQVEAVVGPPRDAWDGHRASIYAFQFEKNGYESWIGGESQLLVLYDAQRRAVDVKRVPVVCTCKHHWWE